MNQEKWRLDKVANCGGRSVDEKRAKVVETLGDQRERHVVIKEACGNTAVALAFLLILLWIKQWRGYPGDQTNNHITSFGPIVITIIALVVVLYWRHQYMALRQRKIDDEINSLVKPNENSRSGVEERPRKILVTGYSGIIGHILMSELAGDFELYGVDVRVTEQRSNVFQADLSDRKEARKVLEHVFPVDCIIHLAADSDPDAIWESVLKNNIMATKNVYELARLHRVKRVIFASSNHVTGMYEGKPRMLHKQTNPRMITVRDEVRPDGDYGASKAFGEALARQYFELYNIESICLRIGTVLVDDDPTRDERHRKTWLSHSDLVHLVRRSIVTGTTFGIYYGVSNNKGRFWDISNARAEIGFEPVDDASVM